MKEVERVFAENRDYLWGHCYRMLGVAADAEDVVQETFVRALEKPPADLDRPWRPWLLTVASRLALDQLRRRRRRGWIGPFLPEPVELAMPEPAGQPEQQARAEQADSLSYAFLLALESLTAQQRAVLLLRDVQEESVAETAAILGMSEANVKVVLHRARKALERARAGSPKLDGEQKRRIGRALETLLKALAGGDLATVEATLAADVRFVADGNGRYHAAKKPVIGSAKVATFLGKLRPSAEEQVFRELRFLNGIPALYVERPAPPQGLAPRFVILIDTDAEGQVREIYSVLAPEKLAAQRRILEGDENP